VNNGIWGDGSVDEEEEWFEDESRYAFAAEANIDGPGPKMESDHMEYIIQAVKDNPTTNHVEVPGKHVAAVFHQNSPDKWLTDVVSARPKHNSSPFFRNTANTLETLQASPIMRKEIFVVTDHRPSDPIS
jgi:hypothetical protein